MATFRAKYTAAEKKEFGKRLRKIMTDRGLTGADLARQATLQLPAGDARKKPIGRDTISWCLNGRSIPQPITLTAMGRALNTDLSLLLPRGHAQRRGEAPPDMDASMKRVDMSLRPDGTMDITIVMNIPQAAGWEIINLATKHGQSAQPK